MGNSDCKSQGQALLEFALILPVLILLMMGIFDMGRAIYAYNAVAYAAREGARAGVIATRTDAEIRQVIKESVFLLDLQDNDIIITPAGSRSSGDTITVQVNYNFTAITPLINNFLPGGSLELTSSASMYVE